MSYPDSTSPESRLFQPAPVFAQSEEKMVAATGNSPARGKLVALDEPSLDALVDPVPQRSATG
ncbi:hypothetical protein [Nocardia carnea]|uniref:hypothetical protein n=1 Tax=Nocardia carnea TaxID=37328 RepID=UPI002457406D|nr:hypothetical protein [Nocardia carnea]